MFLLSVSYLLAGFRRDHNSNFLLVTKCARTRTLPAVMILVQPKAVALNDESFGYKRDDLRTRKVPLDNALLAIRVRNILPGHIHQGYRKVGEKHGQYWKCKARYALRQRRRVLTNPLG